MNFERGRWIGFGVGGLMVFLIGLAVMGALTDSTLVRLFFSKFCHQFDSRCHHIQGVALPICVRCIWIYIGFALGHVLFVFWNPNPQRTTRALMAVIAIMFMDVGMEFLGFYHNVFWTRATTGFLFGLVVSRFTLLGLRQIFCELSNPITYVKSRFLPSRTR